MCIPTAVMWNKDIVSRYPVAKGDAQSLRGRGFPAISVGGHPLMKSDSSLRDVRCAGNVSISASICTCCDRWPQVMFAAVQKLFWNKPVVSGVTTH
ncbi:hypothetical protein NPIL_197081 [Nephila pilipes]|uniref:Uncharacterized protein n=1 Tax=Nephila pilipes TaxID=299642 RepID=A0A8X6PJG9_NEPPI|nr:hypothetical protein NPIL_197081 [Nephila pilipes]